MINARKLLSMFVISLMAQPAVFRQNSAAAAEKETLLSELSGVLHKEEKTIMPYLVLDGSNGRCYLRGKVLANYESGAPVFVRGVLHSQCFEDRSGPNAPAPFRKGWVVYMDVNQVQPIKEPFGEEKFGQESVSGAATLQPLQCDIVLEAIPNPLTLRMLGTQSQGLRYGMFMSTHATMPPMPNVRVEVRDTNSGRIRACTPVVPTEKRDSVLLKRGETADIQVYHRGCEDLPPGTYEVSVSLFGDEDAKQQIPIAVSSSITVIAKPQAVGDGKGQ